MGIFIYSIVYVILKKQNFKFLFAAMQLIAFSCIDPYDINTEGDDRILTVDGLISTAPGPHEVRLTWASQYSDPTAGTTITVNNAKVEIIDSDGKITQLNERVTDSVTFFWAAQNRWETWFSRRPSGVYLTPVDFRAEVGKVYALNITTNIGEKYVSLPEKVVASNPIDSVTIRPYSEAGTNPLLNQTGFILDAYFKDDPTINNYYLWKPSNGWGVLISFPELYRTPPSAGRVLTPKSCCKKCFLPETRLSGSFTATDDILFDGLTTQYPALFIPEDGFRFMERYRITLNQHSISENGYQFLKLVQQQLSIQGSVFDPLPANIRGNIRSVDNPEEQVLGYFFATDVSSKTVYMNRTDLPIAMRKPIAKVEDDCREFFGFTGSFIGVDRIGVTPPSDWKDN